MDMGQRGFNLAEVAIAMGVSAIVIGGVMTTLNLVTRGNSQNDLNQSKNEIVNSIRTQSLNPDNLVVSAEITNSLGSAGLTPDYGPTSTINFPDLLRKCLPSITNTPGMGCDKSAIEEPGKGFLFYLAADKKSNPDSTIAGEDVYYKSNGIRCTPTEAASDSACPLTARIWFEPNCMDFGSTCNKAISLIVRYSVGLRADYKGESSTPNTYGEFYVPLQKGILMKNLLTQSDTPIYPNSHGVYVVPKYYGYAGQFAQGLRFEVSVSDPTSFKTMRMQSRTLTGPDAKSYDDTVIPEELKKKDWEDVPTPDNASMGAWSIDLSGAGPNQTFNFGTQTTVAANSRTTPAAFTIGKTKASGLDPIFHWTVNADRTDFVPPSFKSGFYQFRVLTKDTFGGEIESTNYITVRLVGTPEFQYVDGVFDISRNCIDTITPFTVLVGDDEEITFSQLKIGSTELATPTISGSKGQLKFNFLNNQPAGPYPLTLTLKNRFSDVSLDTGLIPRVEDLKTINLADVPITASMVSNPEKIRYLSTGTVGLTYTSGNCCNAIPKATWSFLASPYFSGGLPILRESSTNSSADYTTSMSCSVTGNSRTCSTSIVATGFHEGPNMSSPPNDIQARFDLGAEATNSACQFTADKPAGDPVVKYIPVVNLPTIHFYLSESLWLHNIPGGPATTSVSPNSIKPIAPRVYLRMDFSPAHDVEVYVVDATSPDTASPLCPPITFTAGTGTTPIDKYCDITNTSFSGVLELRRKDDNPLTNFNKIAYETETTCPFVAGCDAQIAGAIHHTICQRSFASATATSINNVPMPLQLTIPATEGMNDSPFGVTSSGGQYAKNDYGVWTAGRKKNLRCYDNWVSNNYLPNLFSSPNNKQDYYDVYKYNNETRFTIIPTPDPIQYDIVSPGATYTSTISFSNFFYQNKGSSYDYSADNVPFFYMVSQNGTPNKINWPVPNPSGAYIIVGPQPWEDITSQLSCTGLSSNLKLYRIRPNLNWNTSTLTVTGISGMSRSYGTIDLNKRFSYFFACDYGRWHPTGYGSSNWTD